MKLIAGLGNPGKEYANTRHNAGFMAMDLLADQCGVSLTSEKWEALVCSVRINGEAVLLMKPMTYMNLSGKAISQAVRFYQINPEDILILHDDMDIPVGDLRIRRKGSSGGQNGMKNIIQSLGTEEIARIRIGVDHDRSGHVADWVLSPIPKAEREAFEIALKTAAEAAYAWVNTPLDKVMNKYNIKTKK